MRKILLILAIVAVAGVGLLVNQRGDQGPDYGQLQDCTTGAIDAPTLEAIDTWTGTPAEAVVISDLPEPTSLSASQDLTLVAYRTGEIRSLDGTAVWTEPEVLHDGAEQGLLDVLIDPARGLIFTSLTNVDGDLEIRSRPIDSPSAGDYGQVLLVEQPHEFHNGGDMELGPNGHMFISLGDGGPSGDLHGHPQNLDSLLGKLLRIDPHSDGYSIPDDNPTVDGEPVAQWAYGLRNAWRYSIDGDQIWLGDVGNWCTEEINVMPASNVNTPVNFGWSAFEGTSRGKGPIPDEHQPPFLELTRDHGICAVVGGAVYRGEAFPDLDGMYVFSDYCRGGLLALDPDDPETVLDVGIRAPLVTSLAIDDTGELLVLSQSDGIFSVRPE